MVKGINFWVEPADQKIVILIPMDFSSKTLPPKFGTGDFSSKNNPSWDFSGLAMGTGPQILKRAGNQIFQASHRFIAMGPLTNGN